MKRVTGKKEKRHRQDMAAKHRRQKESTKRTIKGGGDRKVPKPPKVKTTETKAKGGIGRLEKRSKGTRKKKKKSGRCPITNAKPPGSSENIGTV